jgi:FkbM family methyltransferase
VVKKSIKRLIKSIPINFTLNQKYDSQTKQIMKIVLESDSTFVDVGSHKGEILSIALKISPNGSHHAFEPIPKIHEKLDERFGKICKVKNLCISNEVGESSFNYVESNPAYSGIKIRNYPKKEKISKIKVKLDTLDNQLLNQDRLDMIKIDVEGGELNVLKGSVRIMQKFHPVILFEHGQGASEFYNTTPEDIYRFFQHQNYEILTLKNFINNIDSLSEEEFRELYDSNLEYYFLAKLKVSVLT